MSGAVAAVGVAGILEPVRAIQGAAATAKAARNGSPVLSRQRPLASATYAPPAPRSLELAGRPGFCLVMACGPWGGSENGCIPPSAMVDVYVDGA